MAKAKSHTDTIDSVTLSNIKANSAFVKRFVTDYCKRCYFHVTKFSRLAAQKHIRGLLNMR